MSVPGLPFNIPFNRLPTFKYSNGHFRNSDSFVKNFAENSDKMFSQQTESEFCDKPTHLADHSKRRRQKNEDFELDAPQRKIRITEDKMAARLRNFHISNQSQFDSNWFFIQKPKESFQDIENRLSDDEDEDVDAKMSSSENGDNHTDDEKATIKLSKDMQSFIKTKRDEQLMKMPLYSHPPTPCLDLILWKPPGDFIKDLVPPPCDMQDATEKSPKLPNSSVEEGYTISYPPSPVDDDSSPSMDNVILGKRRNRNRQNRAFFTKPLIEDVSNQTYELAAPSSTYTEDTDVMEID